MIAEFADIFHRVGNEDYGLVLSLERFEIIGAFLLEGGITDSENFI